MKIITPIPLAVTPKMEVMKPSKEKLCITTNTGHHIIYKKDISFLTADGNYTRIHFNEGQILCSQTIRSVLLKLDQSRYVRIHKSHAINIDFLILVDNAFSHVILKNGERLSIARSKKQTMKDALNKLFD
jgi:two-component system LytT family response regulator